MLSTLITEAPDAHPSANRRRTADPDKVGVTGVIGQPLDNSSTFMARVDDPYPTTTPKNEGEKSTELKKNKFPLSPAFDFNNLDNNLDPFYNESVSSSFGKPLK